jgi:integrase
MWDWWWGRSSRATQRRDLPISRTLADRLAALDVGPREPVFRSAAGTMLDPDNLAMRVLVPACEKAGVPWAGFHTFRHTVASRLFAEGRNVVQVQRWLGHHSASSRSTHTSTCSTTTLGSRYKPPAASLQKPPVQLALPVG